MLATECEDLSSNPRTHVKASCKSSSICNLSALTKTWEVKTGQSLEGRGPVSLIYTVEKEQTVSNTLEDNDQHTNVHPYVYMLHTTKLGYDFYLIEINDRS